MTVARVACFIILLLSISMVKAQDTIPVKDSAVKVAPVVIATDTAKAKKHIPRKATIRSAIIPGWGQIYNKKAWKVPIVYAAIGIPVGTFIYNKNWYNKTSEAAKMLSAEPPDTANYMNRVDPELWVFFTTPNSLGALLNYRNEFRRNMDYSILIALVMWGLNIVDATVDAHLRDFDVSEDLSMKIKPTFINNTMTPGVSVVFTIGKHPGRYPKTLY
ncbi:MAG TPA: DUF5683 domain-containing protein [Flavitalea sp.]|nr:DUF5683 domain-containing protein [Flavitalea sp.]